MRAGYAAVISAALTALALIALLPQIAPNTPYLPRATATKTETLTKTTTLTTTKTTVSTATLTQTITETQKTTATTTKTLIKTTTQTTTEWATKTQTTTAWKTKTTTETQTETETRTITATKTTTKTETQTRTVTTTEWRTETVTRTAVVSSFQLLPNPDEAIRLIARANKTVVIYVPYPLLGFLPSKFSPTVSRILNTTLQTYEHRRIDVYVVINYCTICLFTDRPVKNEFIKYLDVLNKTLPPKHVLEVKSEEWFYTYPFQQHFLAIIMVDFKYIALIKAGYHPPNVDYDYVYLIYNPRAVNKTMSVALEILRNFDNPNFYHCFYCNLIWVWDGCKKHE